MQNQKRNSICIKIHKYATLPIKEKLEKNYNEIHNLIFLPYKMQDSTV